MTEHQENLVDSVKSSKFWKSFQPLSAPLDWCEPNYVVSPHIAEFYNTISNVLFYVLPPLMAVLFSVYARHVTWGCHLVWFLLFLVGLGSTYFHATLSLAGQLMDEIGILWVLMASLCFWYPKKYLPTFFTDGRSRFQVTCLFITILITCLSVYWPEINAIALLSISGPVITVMVLELKRVDDKRVTRFAINVLIVYCTAIAIWVIDRVYCDLWQNLGFPYLHSIWHLIICYACHKVCVLFAYFDADYRTPEQKPVLRFWPSDDHEIFGMPYVTLRNPMYRAGP